MIAVAFLLTLILPLKHALKIVSPIENEIWDVAHDQIIFWDYNSSDPPRVSLSLSNPGWAIEIDVYPDTIEADDGNSTDAYDSLEFHTSVQNVSLRATWFAKELLRLNYYNDKWQITLKDKLLAMVATAGPFVLIDTADPAYANATHLPALPQRYSSAPSAMPVPAKSWFWLFGITLRSCIAFALCIEAAVALTRRRMHRARLNAGKRESRALKSSTIKTESCREHWKRMDQATGVSIQTSRSYLIYCKSQRQILRSDR